MTQALPSTASSPSTPLLPTVTRLQPARGVSLLAQQLMKYKDTVADAKVGLLDSEDLQKKIMADVETAAEEAVKARTLLASQEAKQKENEREFQDKLTRLRESCAVSQQSSSPALGAAMPLPATSSSFTSYGVPQPGAQDYNGAPQWGPSGPPPWIPQASNVYLPPHNNSPNNSLPHPHFFY